MPAVNNAHLMHLVFSVNVSSGGYNPGPLVSVSFENCLAVSLPVYSHNIGDSVVECTCKFIVLWQRYACW